jgi:hypothetical protein
MVHVNQIRSTFARLILNESFTLLFSLIMITVSVVAIGKTMKELQFSEGATVQDAIDAYGEGTYQKVKVDGLEVPMNHPLRAGQVVLLVGSEVKGG